MPRPCNNPPSLDPVMRDDLDRLVRSPRTPAAIYRRALAIALLVKGARPSDAAKLSGLHRVNVFRVSKRFKVHGVAGLQDMPRRRIAQRQIVAGAKSEQAERPSESALAQTLRHIRERNLRDGDD